MYVCVYGREVLRLMHGTTMCCLYIYLVCMCIYAYMYVCVCVYIYIYIFFLDI